MVSFYSLLIILQRPASCVCFVPTRPPNSPSPPVDGPRIALALEMLLAVVTCGRDSFAKMIGSADGHTKIKSGNTDMRFACYVLIAAALVVSTSCTTPTVDSNLATTSLRNSVYDECAWSVDASTLTRLIPNISSGRDGFQRITKAICAAAKSAPAPASPGNTVTVDVEGKSVRGRFLAPGEKFEQAS